MLELHVLRSGKNGSCYAVRPQGAQEFVCVDCGITAKTFVEACSQAGLVPFKLQAFLITHAHGGQVKGLKSTLTWLAKRGVTPPLHAAPSVLEASRELQELSGLYEVRELEALRPLDVARMHVLPFRTFHNNEDKGGCYNFRFEELPEVQGRGPADSMAILSDAGVLSKQAASALEHARLIAVECNYDPKTLKAAAEGNKSVSWAVDVRGNFSNEQAATVVRGFAWEGLRDVVAMHLSSDYNTPELAIRSLEEAVRASGCNARVTCSSADVPVSVLPREAKGAGEEPKTATSEAPAEPQAAAAEVPAEPQAVAANTAEGTQDDAACPDDKRACTAPQAPTSDESASQGTACSLAGPQAVAAGIPAEPQAVTAEVLAEPQPAAENAAEATCFEDILPLPQAREAGLVDATGLIAAWEAQGHTCNPTPDELIDALAAFGMLDPQDLMPTDAGVAAGIWVAFDPDDPAGALRPVLSLARAAQIRELIEG